MSATKVSSVFHGPFDERKNPLTVTIPYKGYEISLAVHRHPETSVYKNKDSNVSLFSLYDNDGESVKLAMEFIDKLVEK